MTALCFTVPAFAQEGPDAVIEDAPVAAAEVQEHALPGGTTDQDPAYAASIASGYDSFDPAPYAKQISQVEEYLSSFKTLESRFSQTSYGRADIVQGTLQISRPGKMRLEYVQPDRIEILVNGRKMRLYDMGLDQVTYGEIPDTPFEVLLYENVSFEGSSRVVDLQEDDASLAITVKPDIKDTKIKRNFMALTLVFTKNPMTLKRLVRTDAQNHSTTIHLLDTAVDVPLDDDLFNLKNPTKKKKKN